ncbi:MAG TPA: S8 family serine peptidase [Thermoanaerobaculia bacterium]|nr:S8 family serine peptidase [Thermoanaerobaculia bacterium]
MRFRIAPALCFALSAAAAITAAQDLGRKVDPWVLDTASRGETEFLVMLRDQADLRGARGLPTKTEKGAFVADALAAEAAQAQSPILALLESRGAAHRAYWVANLIWVRGGLRLVEELAARDDVFHVYANPTVRLDGPLDPRPAARPSSPDTIEWNITKVHAPDVWALGYTGQGVVVAGEDTGYQWDHPAIKGKYRGWNGSTADHNYNWHDAIHSGGGSCGADAPAPCDDFGHGTHTMGTMVGDDGGANQIGMAPDAQWIGCRNMNVGAGTPETYAECFQWFIAPTNLAGQNPDPSKAPHVINNSWGCPPDEGCTDVTVLQAVVESVRAAGIEVVVSAGNDGSSCGTVDTPAAIYAASFSVGATDNSDTIADFSSRGPVTVDGSNRLKPNVSAPGVGVRSCVPGNGYESLSGTSMAGPHVAGLVALLLSADAGIVGDPDSIEPIITATAVPRTTTQSCGGVPGSAIPNNTYGWGRVDALAAVLAASADLSVSQTDSPDPTLPGIPLTYTLTVSNAGPATANGVALSDTLSLIAVIGSATPSQGTCTLLSHAVTCGLGAIASGASATVSITVTPSATGTITSSASVSCSQRDPNLGNNAFAEQTEVVACPFAAPAITAPVSVPPAAGGLAAGASSGAGHADAWVLTGGTLDSGQGTSAITFTSGDPGTTMVLELVDSLADCSVPAPDALVSVDFLDVPPADPFHAFVNTVARNGVTAGCGGGNYCPATPVSRAQMAVFLLKSKFGASHVPPAATGTVFTDVPQGSFAADWIEELAALGVTGGCGNGAYCPMAPVTRAQMAVFLLKTHLGSAYVPPAATGIFGDVPVGAFAAAWIEDLYGRAITGGCSASPLLYCPDNPSTRGQMAVFLTKTFSLP